MYVCLCNAITDKQIRRAARTGVSSLYELRAALGVAAGCGSCARTAEESPDLRPRPRLTPKTFGC
jgi:bacterioferritin-associated ferredoxin